MKFAEQIPNHRRYLERNIASLKSEIIGLWAQIDDENDVARDHGPCSCDFCPYANFEPAPELSPAEEAEIRAMIDHLESTQTDYKRTLNSLDAYAKLVGAEVPA